jgi:hypothetical protein
MAAPDYLRSVWSKTPVDPSNHQLNPGRDDRRCQTQLFPLSQTKGQIKTEKAQSDWIRRYGNANYKEQCDFSKMLDTHQQTSFQEYVERSAFFAFFQNEDDGEAKQRKIYAAQYAKNPRFLTDKQNDKEAEENVESKNSIAKQFMIDTGAGDFDYDQENKDQIGLVQRSNQSYISARDRYFIPPRAGDVTVQKKNSMSPQLSRPLSINLSSGRGVALKSEFNSYAPSNHIIFFSFR